MSPRPTTLDEALWFAIVALIGAVGFLARWVLAQMKRKDELIDQLIKLEQHRKDR